MNSNMAKTFDLYGFRTDDLEAARASVESALGVQLQAHESSYHCGDYYCLGKDGEENLILQRNFDDFEEEWTEEQFKSTPILLYVNHTQRPEELEEALTSRIGGIALLRRERI